MVGGLAGLYGAGEEVKGQDLHFRRGCGFGKGKRMLSRGKFDLIFEVGGGRLVGKTMWGLVRKSDVCDLW